MARAMSEAGHIDVAKTADLARLRLTPEEAESYRGQLDRILEYIGLLGRVDTTGVEPMAHPLGLTDSVRADAVVESLPVEAALANAPARVGDQILVPRVVE
jgi:aspartyl-tRNA(Asn)/glutamyl-tRNA(Gln) amidotransferase subunit C